MISCIFLAHQNRTIAIASDLRVDGAKSPEIPQKEGILGSEIAARNRRSLATFLSPLKSQCIIAVSCLGNRAISGARDRKSQKSLRFRCAELGCRLPNATYFVRSPMVSPAQQRCLCTSSLCTPVGAIWAPSGSPLLRTPSENQPMAGLRNAFAPYKGRNPQKQEKSMSE